MGTFIQLVVDGLSTGSIYAALGLAIVLVSPLLVAILISVAASFALGALIERYVMRRFEQGDPDTAVVVTIAMLTLITGICAWLWTYDNRIFPSLFPLSTVTVGGAVLSIRSIGTTLVIVATMLVLQVLFLRTKLGLALRAVSINPYSASLSGMPVGHLLMVGWGLVAAVGAALVAPSLSLTPGMMDGPLVYALAAVILGGVSSPLGVVVAAWLIGVLENLAAVYVPFIGYDLKIAVPFMLIFIVLIVRPQGLFGRREVVRV